MSRSEDETVPSLKLIAGDRFQVDVGNVEPKQVLGAMVRRSRLKRGVTLMKLAAAASMNPVMLGEIERGKRPATQAHIQAIAEALKIHEGPLIKAAQLWHKEHWKGNNEMTLEPNGMKVAAIIPPAYRVVQLEDELDRCIIDLSLARDGFLDVAKAFSGHERHGAISVVAADHVNRISSAAKRAHAIRHESWGKPVAPEGDGDEDDSG